MRNLFTICPIFALVMSLLFCKPASADILIGAVGPFTGQYASLGEQMKTGARQAVQDINAAGGVNGEKLSLVLGDDACDPKQAVAVANDMAGRGISLVIGHFCSGSTIPAASVYAEEGIVQITPASSSPKITDERAGPGVFRVCGRDDQQGHIAGSFILERFPDARLAIIHDKTAYGKGLADSVRAVVNSAGKKEVLYEAYTAGEKDYTAFVSKLRKNKVEVLYLGGYHSEAGLITRQMRDQMMETVLIGGDSLLTDEYWRITGPAGNGTLMTFLPDPSKNPEAAPVIENFVRRGVKPRGFILYTYAAIQVWAEAAKRAGTTKYEQVSAALSSGEFDTILGKISFDEKGDPRQARYNLYEWVDGRFQLVDRRES